MKSNSLFTSSLKDTKDLQQSLVYPYLEYFIRNDKNNYYKKLLYNRGLAKDTNGNLKNKLKLVDLKYKKLKLTRIF